MASSTDDLTALAKAYGVATSYEDWAGRHVDIAPDVVVSVLKALGVDASDPRAALRRRRAELAARLVPSTVVADAGAPHEVRLGGADLRVSVALEDGTTRALGLHSKSVRLPADLPLGWHVLEVHGAEGRTQSATLIVAPTAVAAPARQWGWAVQLYQIRSASSWGMGDYADLATIARWSAAAGAGAVLVNPLHAVAPVTPVEPSPYYPTSRRFRSPVYLRPEQTQEYAAADAATRARVDALGDTMRRRNHEDTIDRDAVWEAKREALELLYDGRERAGAGRTAAIAAFEREAGDGLRDFATFCALAEHYGVPWQQWPEELHSSSAAAVAAFRQEASDRVGFHVWLQFLCDEQLTAAQEAGLAEGMSLGVIHDLAVGVDLGGADAWALQDALAVSATIGAPPDSFNQQGQDWRLPPWSPTALAAAGYAPYRDMLRAVLRHAGGVRIDHVMGLFRLWWIPEGETADRGSYVYYDDRALLGVLLLEAHRAGAVVVGEDLGTVEKRVADELGRRQVLGSDVLWFERDFDDDGNDLGIRPPEDWRELALASITTHDLPTVAEWLGGEHVRVRHELGLLGRPVAEEQAQADRERAEWIALLRARGLLAAGKFSVEDVIVALHEVLARSPARLVMGSLCDAVADRRQPNLPGTVDEYPSWRIPLADGTGRPVLLEDVMRAPLAARIAETLGRVRVTDARSDTVSPTSVDRMSHRHQTREQ